MRSDSLMADALIADYKARKGSQKALAAQYEISVKVLTRILSERGIPTPVPRLKGEAHMVMKLLKSLNIEPANLEAILTTKIAQNKEFIEEYLSKRPMGELARILYKSITTKTESA